MPAHIEETAASIKDLMIAEFLERTRAQTDDAVITKIVQAANAKPSSLAQIESKVSVVTLVAGADDGTPLDEGLYPLIVGLHRLNEIPMTYQTLQTAGCQQLKAFLR